jgi:uncharacterized protein YoxC
MIVAIALLISAAYIQLISKSAARQLDSVEEE